MCNFLYVCLTVLFVIPCSQGGNVRVDKFEGKCKGYPHPYGYFTNIKKVERNGVLYLQQALNVTKEIPSIDKLIITSKRCPSVEDLNHCEEFRNLTVPNLSILAIDTYTPWGKKLEYLPPLKFPLKPGLYTSKENPVDVKWSIISSKGYWRTTSFFVSDRDEVLICLKADGEIY